MAVGRKIRQKFADHVKSNNCSAQCGSGLEVSNSAPGLSLHPRPQPDRHRCVTMRVFRTQM